MKAITIAVASLILLAGCGDASEDTATGEELVRPAKVAIAQTDKEAQFKTFPGVTEAAKKSVLAFRVSGKISDLPIHAGQDMKKGDLIARLDEATYKNTVAERQAAYDLAQLDLDRQKTLYQQKHVAKSKLDIAQSTFAAAAAALKQAQDNQGYTRLVAPFDGVVSRIDVEHFQNVQAGEPVVQFQSNTETEVVFNVPENLFLRLNEDNTNEGRVKVRFDALPERAFDALYQEHDMLPDAATRSFKVTVSMPMPKDLTVLPGMSVSVIADLSQVFGAGQNAVAVPVEAIFEADGKTWVWRLDGEDRARRTAVTPGVIANDTIQIKTGLNNGDRVVAAGISHVREGQKVRPLTKERGL